MDEAQAQINWYRLTRDFTVGDELISVISFNLMIFAILVLVMALLKGLFMFFMRQTIIVSSRHIEYDLKNEIYEHYQNMDHAFYARNNTGDLMNRISEDVGRVRMYLGPALMYTVNLVVMFILVIYAMIQVNPALTFYTLIPLPVLSFIIYYVESIINRKSERVQSKLSDLSTFVQEAFSGIRVIKAFSREQHSHKEFSKLSDEYKSASMDLVKVNALFQPSLVVLIGLSTIITIYVGGIKVMQGEITIGNIAEFVIYVNMLTWPVAALGWVVSLVQRAAASQERINEFLFTQPAITSGPVKLTTLRGDIEFRNVTFRYPGSSVSALENVSFHLQPGKSLAITGRTGSGKSTIANLMLRFLDPTSGKITIDGTDLREIDLNALRSLTGFVPQEVFLFSDTIANNIAFGLRDDLSETEKSRRVEDAAANACILNGINEFPGKFNTRVGERGITLSGGQKQRISIARAIIRNPVLLVFDDCLSAVDTLTEEEILRNLQVIMKNKSTIIISHRISSVKNADQIIVLDAGRVVEQGTHTELISLNGTYAELVERQKLEEEII